MGKAKDHNVQLALKEISIKTFIHSSCAPVSDSNRQKSVRKIISSSFDYDRDDFKRIWKGLFYCVWYSEVGDYEELVYEICYNSNVRNLREFIFAGFYVLAKEWEGIDHLRLDKYYFLTRHFLNRTLRFIVHECPNDTDLLDNIFETMESAAELLCHVVEVFLEESRNVLMRKVIWDAKNKARTYFLLIKPHILAMARAEDSRVMDTINEFVFDELRKNIFTNENEQFRHILSPLIVEHILNVCKEEGIKSKPRKMLLHIAHQLK